MNVTKTIVIIGAGISGLTAGIYAEQHGFHAIVLEKNPSVGGMCTGWYRNNFYIDGCIHWLTGTKEGTLLNEMWHNVDAIKNPDDILYLPSWGTFEYQGQSVTFWCDLDKAEKEWTNLSPIDKKMIHRFFKMVRDFSKVELPLDLPIPMLPLNRKIKLGLKVLSIWPSYLLSMVQTREQFASKFKSPVIKNAIINSQVGQNNLFSMIYSYATIANGDGGIPKGGSKPMVERMKEKLILLGGSVKTNANVESFVIENKKVTGCKLSNGQIISGDYFVSCLDTTYTLKKLLRDQYSLKPFEKRLSNPYRFNAPSTILLNYSIPKNNHLPIPFSFDCEPFVVNTTQISHLTIRSYAYDNSFTRGDKTVLSVMIDQNTNDYAYYRELSKDKKQYQDFKNWLANKVKTAISIRFPELGDSLQVLDVATPTTFSRYVNTYRGAYMSFSFTHKDPMFSHHGKLKGLDNFYLSGQWLQSPGGLPIAMTQGKFAIQRICKREKLSFVFSPVPNKKKA